MPSRIVLSLTTALTLALLVACSKSPEARAESAALVLQSKSTAVSQLAEKKASGSCYAAIHLWYLEDDDSVAAAAADIANLAKDDWLLVAYNQEFNSRRTAIFKSKSC